MIKYKIYAGFFGIFLENISLVFHYTNLIFLFYYFSFEK